MSEIGRPGGLRPGRPSARRLAPVALVALLGLTLLVSGEPPLPTGAPGEVGDAIAALSDEPAVLVAFDPDIGTYPEIREATRATIQALLDRLAYVAVVSYTPEGRALAVAEVERLRGAEANLTRLLDLGYLPGAEAALVRSVERVVPDHATGRVVDALASREGGAGIEAFDAVLVVGGADLGARSWVEQVWTRVPGVVLLAMAPTAFVPELAPLRDAGQLAALEGGRGRPIGAPQPTPATLVGGLVAIAAILHAAGAPLLRPLRLSAPRLRRSRRGRDR